MTANLTSINILIIGLGYYARRTYLPVLAKMQSQYSAKIVCGFDIAPQAEVINGYLHKQNMQIPVYYTSEYQISKQLTPQLERQLDLLVEKYQINSVIISTEPLSHFKYADWALKRRLHILMDKPITTELGVSTSLEKAKMLLDDFIYLKNRYLEARLDKPELVFNLMSQRRFHPVFHFVRDKLQEVLNRTNCPVSSVQCSHSDGQWRFPTEIIEQDYHPYNQGYGKCSHSGYHAFDIVSWLLNSAYTEKKSPDTLELSSFGVYPTDILTQFNIADYQNLFSDFDKFNSYSQSEFMNCAEGFGEVDAFTNFALKQGDKTLTVGSINLIHNGSSQRNWVTATGKDLYKGNGRIKHESYYIVQSAFQAILYEAYQSTEDHDIDSREVGEFGGKNHIDIHVFRNKKLFPDWKAYERFTAYDISDKLRNGVTNGIQEESRGNCIQEFLGNIKSPKAITQQTSNILGHSLGTTLLSSVYCSLVLRRNGGNANITQKLKI